MTLVDTASENVPDHIYQALERVWEGASGESVESDILELKEDPSCIPASPKGARAGLIEKLIDESICFANSDVSEGYILIGVSDRQRGPEAFTGTNLETDDLEKKIYQGTVPNLRVEVSVVVYRGVRLLCIRIPEGLALYARTRGQAGRRVKTSCVPLSEEERRYIASNRANPDYSNSLSCVSVDQVPAESIAELARLLNSRKGAEGRGVSSFTRHEILRELGLLDQRTGYVRRAGEILLLPAEGANITIRHLWRPMVGADPQVNEFSMPLILALPSVRRLIGEQASREVERIQFPDGQEYRVPRFPESAIDEALTNAVIHRDWQLAARPIVIDQSPGVLKIWSPGSLPVGVSADKILVTQSMPRNARLMTAMRVLGLAEESSRGFDRMWVSMISTGRPAPEVISGEDFVEVVMSAAAPDTDFIRLVHAAREAFPDYVWSSVNTLIVAWALWHHPVITFQQVVKQTQVTELEARELMGFLANVEIVEALSRDEWGWGSAMQDYVSLPSGAERLISMEAWVRERAHNGGVTAAEVAYKYGVERQEVTALLRRLRGQGLVRIDPSGPQRGPNTLWVSSGGGRARRS
ncbi:ATP-binding protein [Rothia nasimurium]|uniref:ATP-binding protein n=1 Tax=Rothia nasimurium TaxID=85336 RepID=UPI001F451AF9|nr:ATP-binding protein [Rothia nasimurium]